MGQNPETKGRIVNVSLFLLALGTFPREKRWTFLLLRSSTGFLFSLNFLKCNVLGSHVFQIQVSKLFTGPKSGPIRPKLVFYFTACFHFHFPTHKLFSCMFNKSHECVKKVNSFLFSNKLFLPHKIIFY